MNLLVQKLDFSLFEHYVQSYFDKNIAPLFGIQTSIRRVALGLGLVGSVTWFLSKYVVYRLFLDKTNSIPGPPVGWIPFVGNMREIIREESGVPHKRWTKLYGGIVSYKGPWNEPRILVTQPELVKQILTTNSYDYCKPPSTVDFLKRVLGDGLLVSEGDLHRHQRKMLNPAFSVQAIRDMVPLMAAPGVQLRNKWLDIINSNEDGGATEIVVSAGLSLATLDVIGAAGMGYNFDSLRTVDTPAESKLAKAYIDIFRSDISFFRVLTFFFPLLRFVPTERNLMVKQDLKWLDEESRRLVEIGMERRQKEKPTQKDDSPRTPKDLLTLMVNETDSETGTGMTVKELQNQCLTFLAAGHETTSVSLSWCLWLLAKHPEIQEALREEIKPVFGQVDLEHPFFEQPLTSNLQPNVANLPSYDTINSLPLLNNVCKETLRLIPPVPTTTRISTKEDVLGNYVIPKGTVIFLSPIVSHHSIDIWGPDALEFRPSRWDEPLAKKVTPYEYYPFLAGSRQCIGNRFAMIEMKILLSLLIMDLKYHEKDGFQVLKKQTLTLRPHPNMTLLVEKL